MYRVCQGGNVISAHLRVDNLIPRISIKQRGGSFHCEAYLCCAPRRRPATGARGTPLVPRNADTRDAWRSSYVIILKIDSGSLIYKWLLNI